MNDRNEFKHLSFESARMAFAIAGCCLCCFNAVAQPVVSNVRAAQRAGTGLVDIYYDLASASNALTVSVAVSTNSGLAFNAPAASLSGDLGSGKTPGTGKHVVWNAGTDLTALYFPNVKVRVTADHATAPSGMALIPAGSFTMGDSLDGDSSALPLHTVYVSSFYMDKYDVTEALWSQVFNWATNHGYNFDYPGSVPGSAYSSYSKGPNYPVVLVDWYDSVKWCNARSEMEGRTPAYFTSAAQTVAYRTGQVNVDNNSVKWSSGYRLPTEAEWEKAARGGLSGQRFPWGNTINESQANYDAYPSSYAYDVNSYSGFNTNFNTGNIYTSPVNYFAPNGYGLYDMAGNVWQWCWDWYGTYGSASQTDPRGAASGSSRVFRGGSWVDYYGAALCRSAFRANNGPEDYDYGSNCVGFRSVLPPSGLPVITVQPLDLRIRKGVNATFSVTATGDATLNYQWQLNGTDIVSATGASLTLTTSNLQTGTYNISVVISNGVGVIISRSAQLTVYTSGIGEL